jgi:hypothetical protein
MKMQGMIEVPSCMLKTSKVKELLDPKLSLKWKVILNLTEMKT